jgi:peptide chain release factor 1
MIRVSGKNVKKIFRDEAGGHRWQRIPPTEKRGRIHTSTITVSISYEQSAAKANIRDNDLEITTCRGSGAGGQHRNKTDSAVQIKHKPSGLIVRCESERSQHLNRITAMTLLQARLTEAKEKKRRQENAKNKKQQVGSGMRGDKRRTIRQQDGVVNDHKAGRSWQYKDYVKGNW